MSTQISVSTDQRKNPTVKFEDFRPMQFSNQEKCHACINDTGGFTICYGLRGGLDVFTQVCAFVREDKYLDRVVKQLSRKIPANKIRQIKKALDGRDGH